METEANGRPWGQAKAARTTESAPRPGDAWRARPGAAGSPGVRLAVVLPGHDVLKQLAAGDSVKKARGIKWRGQLATHTERGLRLLPPLGIHDIVRPHAALETARCRETQRQTLPTIRDCP